MLVDYVKTTYICSTQQLNDNPLPLIPTPPLIMAVNIGAAECRPLPSDPPCIIQAYSLLRSSVVTCVWLVERGQPAEDQHGGQGGRQPGPGVQPPQGDHHHCQSVTPVVIHRGAPCITTEFRGVSHCSWCLPMGSTSQCL